MRSKKNRRFSSIYNNILLGSILSFTVTAIFLYILVAVGRFSQIEQRVFTQIILVIILGLLLFNLLYFVGFSRRIRIFRQGFFVLGILLLITGGVASSYVYRIQSSIDRLVNTDDFETVEYSVIGFDERATLENLDQGTLGFIEHDEAFDVIMRDAIRPHSRTVKFMEYSDYHEMLQASLDGQIQYALVPKDYTRLDESFNVGTDPVLPLANAKTLFGFSTEVEGDSSSVAVLDEPFSVLLLGMNGGLADSIIVATVNPLTLNVTMTSLARDSYLPIACYPNQSRDKLNHARARGRQCLEDTITNYLGLEVDFYFETDFYALEKIVDALGGLELESPVAFGGSLPKENNPDEYDEVYVPQGKSKMNGKQAITFARERNHMPRGDFDRQLNQQYVIKEVANAIIKERNPEKLVSALQGASQNIKTNLPLDTIQKLLGYAIQQIDASPLDATHTFRIESSQILGTTPIIRGMSVIVPFKNDVLAAQSLIKQNLETEPTLKNIRNFSISINTPYKTENQKRSKYGDQSGGTISIGNGPIIDNKPIQPNTPAVMIQVPNYTDASQYSRSDLENWAKQNGIKLNITLLELDASNETKYKDGQVYSQDHAGLQVDKNILVSQGLNVTFVVDKRTPEQTPPSTEVPPVETPPTDTPPVQDGGSDVLVVPPFTNGSQYKFNDFVQWANQHGIKYNATPKSITELDAQKFVVGQIFHLLESGKTIEKSILLSKPLNITYIIE